MDPYIPRERSAVRRVLTYLNGFPLGTELLSADLARASGVRPQSLVSQLRFAERAGIVKRRSQSRRKVYWSLVRTPIFTKPPPPAPVVVEEDNDTAHRRRTGYGTNPPGGELAALFGIGRRIEERA
jgi:hypothetical protein